MKHFRMRHFGPPSLCRFPSVSCKCVRCVRQCGKHFSLITRSRGDERELALVFSLCCEWPIKIAMNFTNLETKIEKGYCIFCTKNWVVQHHIRYSSTLTYFRRGDLENGCRPISIAGWALYSLGAELHLHNDWLFKLMFLRVQVIADDMRHDAVSPRKVGQFDVFCTRNGCSNS